MLRTTTAVFATALLVWPAATARAGFELYIVNRDSSNVSVFDAGGNPAPFASSGLNSAQDIAFDAAGNVYVASFNTNAVREYSPTGADLDNFAGFTGRERAVLLAELVQEDLEYRIKAGEPGRAEDYLARYPELREDPAVEVALAVAEFRARRRRNPACDPDEFLRRFPARRAELGHLLDEERAAGNRYHVLNLTNLLGNGKRAAGWLHRPRLAAARWAGGVSGRASPAERLNQHRCHDGLHNLLVSASLAGFRC
jgi:hypothetical protein